MPCSRLSFNTLRRHSHHREAIRASFCPSTAYTSAFDHARPHALSRQVAGSSPSRLVMIPNPHTGKDKGALTLSDTACGVGVYVSQVIREEPKADPDGRL